MDADFSLITFNCLQVDLAKVLKDGFNTGHGFIREPKSIRAAASLACVIIQSSQNDCFGGQSLVGFDFALAKYVDLSFKKALRKKYEEWLEFYDCKITDHDKQVLSKIEKDKNIHYDESIYDIGNEDDHECIGIDDYLDIILDIGADNTRKIFTLACRDVREETQQAMEALVHNFNSLHSRAGKMCAG